MENSNIIHVGGTRLAARGHMTIRFQLSFVLPTLATFSFWPKPKLFPLPQKPFLYPIHLTTSITIFPPVLFIPISTLA
jgi:hypothetical protein